MKLILFFTLLIITSSAIIAQDVKYRLVNSMGNSRSILTFYEDSTFVDHNSSVSCLADENGNKQYTKSEVQGTYVEIEDRLHLKPAREIIKGYSDSLEYSVNQVVSPFFVSNFQIVEYDSLLIFFSTKKLSFGKPYKPWDNTLISTANSINYYDGPISAPMRTIRLSKKKGRRIIDKDIKKVYPEAYRDYILDTPITTNITSFREISFSNPIDNNKGYRTRYLVTFDKGKKDGLKPGMRLYSTDHKSFRNSFVLEYIFESTCQGVITVNQRNKEDVLKSVKYSTKGE